MLSASVQQYGTDMMVTNGHGKPFLATGDRTGDAQRQGHYRGPAGRVLIP